MAVQDRWGKSLLELGGNNALIVNNDADVKMVSQWTAKGIHMTLNHRLSPVLSLLVWGPPASGAPPSGG